MLPIKRFFFLQAIGLLFLRNNDNKSALFQMVAHTIATSLDPDIATVVVTISDSAISNDQVLDLSGISPCDHEEADTRLLLHVQHAKADAIIKTVDTDVVVIAISCFNDLQIGRLWIEFGVGLRKRFIPIHDITSSMPHGDIISTSLPLFHAITGCDTVSSMIGIGKKKAWSCWMKNVESFCEMFASLNLHSSSSLMSNMQTFVMVLFVKNPIAVDIDECRYKLFTKGNSFDKLPPTSNALHQHTRRAIYQAEVWKSCLQRKQNMPSPLEWGWKQNHEGELLPLWSTDKPATEVRKLSSHCGCKSTCTIRCTCKKQNIKCTSLCCCNYTTCNSSDISSSESQIHTDYQRNVFDYLELLK